MNIPAIIMFYLHLSSACSDQGNSLLRYLLNLDYQGESQVLIWVFLAHDVITYICLTRLHLLTGSRSGFYASSVFIITEYRLPSGLLLLCICFTLMGFPVQGDAIELWIRAWVPGTESNQPVWKRLLSNSDLLSFCTWFCSTIKSKYSRRVHWVQIHFCLISFNQRPPLNRISTFPVHCQSQPFIPCVNYGTCNSSLDEVIWTSLLHLVAH